MVERKKREERVRKKKKDSEWPRRTLFASFNIISFCNMPFTMLVSSFQSCQQLVDI